MPRRTYKVGDGAAQAHPFSVFTSKTGQIGVRIGTQRPYKSVSECSISGVGYLIITTTPDGLLVRGEGVVREANGVATITA